MTCPNCNAPHGVPVESCLLGALLAVIVNSRGTVAPEAAARLMESTDIDALWEDLGPVLDTLESGGYSA